VTAPGKGAADLDPIHRRHQAPARPGGAQHAVALQTPGHGTTQGEDRRRVLALKRVAHRILAEGSDPMRQDSPAAFGFQLVQVGNLYRRPEEDRVPNLLPRVAGRLPPFRQGGYLLRPSEDLVQV